MKIRFILSFMACLACVSCKESEKDSFVATVEIDNQVLEREIMDYWDTISEQEKVTSEGDTSVILLFAREINDSVKRFVIDIGNEPKIRPMAEPFFFTCKIGGHHVFVGVPSCYQKKKTAKNYFRLSDQSLSEFEKRFFPNHYRRVQQAGTTSFAFAHAKCRFLTFLNDSLIDKTDRLDYLYAKIKIRIGNEEVEY